MADVKKKNRVIFLIYALILGALIGALTWFFLWAVHFSIDFIWVWLPQTVDIIYLPLIICTAGGFLVGLCKKYFGNVPGVLSVELQELKKNKRADYKNLPGVAISSFLPLIFGGSIGPEAALVSILSGLSTWIADQIKLTAKNVKVYTEIGAAATLSAMFGSPFFGLAETFEPRQKSFFTNEENQSDQSQINQNNSNQINQNENCQDFQNENRQDFQKSNEGLSKPEKNLVYIASAFAAFFVFILLSSLFPETGIYRYEYTSLEFKEWISLLPLALFAGLFGYLYYVFGILIQKGIQPIRNKKVLLATIGGFILGFIGLFLPYTLFSGEAQISQIVSEWTTLSITVLFLTAVLKMFLTRLCFLTGWRGGHIFPIIFAGIVLGYAVSKIIPIDSTFCALICSVSATYMVLRKPAATVLVFMILAPIEYLIPLSLAVIVCSFIPFPKIFEKAEEKEINEELENKKHIQNQEIEKQTTV